MHHAAKHAPRAKHVVMLVLQKGIRVIKFTVAHATLNGNSFYSFFFLLSSFFFPSSFFLLFFFLSFSFVIPHTLCSVLVLSSQPLPFLSSHTFPLSLCCTYYHTHKKKNQLQTLQPRKILPMWQRLHFTGQGVPQGSRMCMLQRLNVKRSSKAWQCFIQTYLNKNLFKNLIKKKDNKQIYKRKVISKWKSKRAPCCRIKWRKKK